MGTAPPSEGVRVGDTPHRDAPPKGAAQRVMANTAATPKAVTLVLVPALCKADSSHGPRKYRLGKYGLNKCATCYR